jgi:hypothetical protein
MSRIAIVCWSSWWLGGAGMAGAQAVAITDSVRVDTVAAGVLHSRIRSSAGPWIVNLVTVDLRRAGLLIRGAHAGDHTRGREKTTSIVRRVRASGIDVLAAVNGDLFDLATGANENNQIVDGAFVKGVEVTDSPYDTFDNAHSQFAVTADGRPLIERFSFRGTMGDAAPRRAEAAGIPGVAIHGVNLRPNLASTVLYNPFYGAATPRVDSGPATAELVLATCSPQPGTDAWTHTRCHAAPGIRRGGGSAIPATGMVLAAHGAAADSIGVFAGHLVDLSVAVAPQRGPVRTLMGGWPRLVVDGRNVATRADSTEGTFPRFSAQRHGRTAVGFSRDSATLYLLVVDGRSTTSVGMSLVELADELRAVGAWQAMNLDGGGSTTMVVRDSLVNAPSDSAGERAVGSALLVTRRVQPR